MVSSLFSEIINGVGIDALFDHLKSNMLSKTFIYCVISEKKTTSFLDLSVIVLPMLSFFGHLGPLSHGYLRTFLFALTFLSLKAEIFRQFICMSTLKKWL